MKTFIRSTAVLFCFLSLCSVAFGQAIVPSKQLVQPNLEQKAAPKIIGYKTISGVVTDRITDLPVRGVQIVAYHRIVDVLPNGANSLRKISETYDLNCKAKTNKKGFFQISVPVIEGENILVIYVKRKKYEDTFNSLVQLNTLSRIDFQIVPTSLSPSEKEILRQKEEKKILEINNLKEIDPQQIEPEKQNKGGENFSPMACTYSVNSQMYVKNLVNGYNSYSCPSSGMYTGYMNMDEFVAGVIAGEMGAGTVFPTEAKKAQAVAARTYAVWRENYPSTGGNCGMAFDDGNCSTCTTAANSTSQQVMTKNNVIIQALFSARCNGNFTRSSSESGCNSNGNAFSYLVCKPCSGHVNCLNTGETPCCNYTNSCNGNSGKVYGHGLGLCQRGCQGFATQGFDYCYMLNNFYTDICVANSSCSGSSACTNWAVTPSTQSVPSGGGTYSANVTASGGCNFNIPSGNYPTWITITSPLTNPFQYTVLSNSGAARSGTIYIRDATNGINQVTSITINQASGSACTNWAVTPATQNVPSGAGSYTANVSATGGCNFNIPSGNYPSWITITTPLTNPFQYNVQSNSGSARSGIIYIRDATNGINQVTSMTVNQAGAGCTPPAAPTLSSPGTTSCPGTAFAYNSVISFSWSSVPNAVGYDVNFSKYPYGSACGGGSNNNVFYAPCFQFTSGTLNGSQYLQPGMFYRWNVQAYSECGNDNCKSPTSNTLYFHTKPDIYANSSPTICSGQSVVIQTNPISVNSPGTVTYYWYKDGTQVYSGSNNSYTATLGGSYTLKLKYSGSSCCPSDFTSESNSINVFVSPTVTPSLNVTASSTSICPGQNVTFTANPTNGGNSPTFQWYVNNALQPGNASTFSTTALTNGAQVYCVVTSNAACVNPTTATSSTITISVNPPPAPSVSVTASATSICPGQNVTFTANPVNGGNAPTFQWFVNNALQPGNSSTFSTSTLTNGAQVYCIVTSNADCVSPTTATSSPVTISVNPPPAPSVSVTASATSICPGQNVTFTANPVNGGNAPTFQWFVNNALQSGNSSTFSTTTLTNGAQVYCVVTSNADCVSPTTATSSPVTISVNPPPAPSVSVTASATSICPGQNVTFTANPTNGGNAPTFQWFVNNALQSGNSSTFSTTTLTNGAQVYCVVTSNADCVSPTTATSSPVTISVNPPPAPSVNVTASATSICVGENVTFTASPINGGNTPTFQWFVSNVAQVGTASTFSTNTLTNGAQVYCVVTSNAACVSPTTATSNITTISVSPPQVPTVSITASPTSICPGQNVTFTASQTNGGIAPTFQWFVNNVVQPGNASTFSTTTLTNGAQVYCVMTSNATCVSPTSATSTPISIPVIALPQPTIVFSNLTIMASNYSGNQYFYSWYFNGAFVSTAPSIPCVPGSYYLVITTNGCTVTSPTVPIDCIVAAQDANNDDYISIYPNPTNDIITIEAKTKIKGRVEITLYNVLGQTLKQEEVKSTNGDFTLQLNLEDLASGIYMVAISSNNEIRTFKIEKHE